MTKTTNYGLPQWEGSDRVLRTDFNEAMADIDAALQANADAIDAEEAARADAVTELSNRSRFTKLWETNITANTNGLEIDLTGIDWTAWDKIHLDIITFDSDSLKIRFNSLENDIPVLGLGGIQGIRHRPRMTFFVGNDPQRWITFQWGATFDDFTLTDAELEKLCFGEGVLKAGTSFTLWGER